MPWYRNRAQKCIINFMLVLLLIALNFKQSFGDCDWICDDGNCIDREYLCDGKPDCPDRSDEIAKNCIQMSAICPSYSYTCLYGACVSGKAKCNGTIECADGSDELPNICDLDKEPLQTKQRGRCGAEEMQCNSGECLDVAEFCNGRINCPDGSDETLEFCADFFCPPFGFRCGYGGCVGGKSKCNGTEECADGSDEAPLLCNRSRNPVTRPPTNRPPTQATTPPTKAIQSSSGSNCKIPRISQNMIVNDYLRGTQLREGAALPLNGIIQFRCESGYRVQGVNQTFCARSGWSGAFPTCEKHCNATFLNVGVSTTASCFDSYHESVKCQNIRPGTTAQIDCALGFRRSYDATSSLENKLTCNDNGKWNKVRLACTMVCGKLDAPVNPFAKGGRPIKNLEAPWHVVIYFIADGENEYTRRCLGSIIAPQLIITAAHCFHDTANEFYDASIFKVVAGSSTDEYSYPDKHSGIQENEVLEFVANGFKEEKLKNDFAIAIMKKPFTFSSIVKPICFKDVEQSEQYIESGIGGFIVGLGPTKTDTTNVLQKVPMKSVSFGDCNSKLHENNASYSLTNDKFCIERVISTGDVCRGDSGGAFVESTNGINNLVGIVSHSVNLEHDCARDGLVVMTNVAYFVRDIKKYIEKYSDTNLFDY